MSTEVLQATTGKSDNDDDFAYGGVSVSNDAPSYESVQQEKTTAKPQRVSYAADTQSSDTIYAALRKEFNRPAKTDPITLLVPNRDRIKVVYDPDIDYDTMQKYYARSTYKKKLDVIQLSLTVLQNHMIGVTLDGIPAMDKDDDPMTIASDDMLSMLGADNPRDALRNLYGSDGHIMAAATAVMTAAGYGFDTEDLEDDDGPKF